MRKYIGVSSKDKPKLKEINYNTLYIRSNVHKELDEDQEELYVYDEIQLEGNEIIEYLDNKQIESEQLITELDLNQIQIEQMLTDIDLKILELGV
ncbi:Phage protein [Candidatus Arthromitus sp. SFB-mouse-NL]|uniref:hypothetical protein n=1 Tax=Candidatus Arthromitus sp. SFB-mouse-NL TaxID=1508644 RepID=UPI00049A7A0D|nr:hypothetical protein [Candidatus Arthromitus sp. SFB-mouse-NL]AID44722.1 Phage protein [Candidatus Arthromitus sp. SFB-mouse-NL]